MTKEKISKNNQKKDKKTQIKRLRRYSLTRKCFVYVDEPISNKVIGGDKNER